jgi:hypothetical protein
LTLLYCNVCGKPWRQIKPRDAERAAPASCAKCRKAYRAAGQRARHRHHKRRLELVGEARDHPATGPLPDLETLMAELDNASVRAAKVAAAIRDGLKPVARAGNPGKMPDIDMRGGKRVFRTD